MATNLLDLFGDPRYLVVGLAVLALLAVNKKVRKNLGALIGPLLILIALGVAYQLMMQKDGLSDRQVVSGGEGEGTGLAERKSIYYTDPEEALRREGEQSGASQGR